MHSLLVHSWLGDSSKMRGLSHLVSLPLSHVLLLVRWSLVVGLSSSVRIVGSLWARLTSSHIEILWAWLSIGLLRAILLLRSELRHSLELMRLHHRLLPSRHKDFPLSHRREHLRLALGFDLFEFLSDWLGHQNCGEGLVVLEDFPLLLVQSWIRINLWSCVLGVLKGLIVNIALFQLEFGMSVCSDC